MAPRGAPYKCCLRQHPLWRLMHQKGESVQRPLITVMRFLLMNPKGSKPDLAGSRQPEADCFWLYMQWSLPAEWYLLPFVSYAAWTKILRLRLRMTVRAGGQERNADYKLRRQPPPQPSAAQPLSNLRTLRTFGSGSRQPSHLKGKRLTMICASLCSFKSCSLCTPQACPMPPPQPSGQRPVKLKNLRPLCGRQT